MRVLAALILIGAVGCGGPATTVARVAKTSRGPHGGPAYPLPSDKGFAEVVVEPVGAPSKGVQQVVLAVYFLKPDLKAPLEPPPTGVSAGVIRPD